MKVGATRNSTLSIIAAMATNRVIGRDNTIPWRLPADLQHFKRLTWGHSLIMGRRTFESIGRPLPGRTTVVLTRRPGYAPKDVLVAGSFDEAVTLAGPGEVFVAGGAHVYRQGIGLADRMHLTMIHRAFDGDAYFPEFDEREWELISEERRHESTEGRLEYSFLLYERRH